MDKQLTNKTLLEILVDELPGLGGWPDAAGSIVQDSDGQAKSVVVGGSAELGVGCKTWVRSGDRVGRSGYMTLASDWNTAIITREQYEQALSEKNKPVMPVMPQPWSGEGLPPVGTVCEIGSEYRMWSRGEVMYVSELTIVFKHHQDDGDVTEGCYFPRSVNFRPIRTPEQIEAERRSKVIASLSQLIVNKCHSDVAALDVYDAIRAGKIEGVKIDG